MGHANIAIPRMIEEMAKYEKTSGYKTKSKRRQFEILTFFSLESEAYKDCGSMLRLRIEHTF